MNAFSDAHLWSGVRPSPVSLAPSVAYGQAGMWMVPNNLDSWILGWFVGFGFGCWFVLFFIFFFCILFALFVFVWVLGFFCHFGRVWGVFWGSLGFGVFLCCLYFAGGARCAEVGGLTRENRLTKGRRPAVSEKGAGHCRCKERGFQRVLQTAVKSHAAWKISP